MLLSANHSPRHLPTGLASLWVVLVAVAVSNHIHSADGALPPGPGPFGSVYIAQPALGAPRGIAPNGWRNGALCNISAPPYSAVNGSNGTAVLQRAIDDCGGKPSGGTVVRAPHIPTPLHLRTSLSARVSASGSLWLQSNLTLRVETGAAIVGLVDPALYPSVYTRSGGGMRTAHASLLNGARCLKLRPGGGEGDACLEWATLSNVVIEGGGLIDGSVNGTTRSRFGKDLNNLPTLLGLLWIDGLTVRDVVIRRPAFWTVHLCFCNNVRVEGINVLTTLGGMDAIDVDSSWNVYIAESTLASGDDNMALKSGQDADGRAVNISTQNVLAERNTVLSGHGLTIGSDMSGGVRAVLFRDSTLSGTQYGARFKSQCGRGGSVSDVVYSNLSGTVGTVVDFSMNYHGRKVVDTNTTLRPEFHGIVLKDLAFNSTAMWLYCLGIPQSPMTNISMVNVSVIGRGAEKQSCKLCSIDSVGGSHQSLACAPNATTLTPTPTPNSTCPFALHPGVRLDGNAHIGGPLVAETPAECCAHCTAAASQGCAAFEWIKPSKCWLKAAGSTTSSCGDSCVSGGRSLPPVPPTPPPPPPSPSPPSPPSPPRAASPLGVIGYQGGESSLVVLNGQLLLVDSPAWCYPYHMRFDHPEMGATCASYIRVVDMATGITVSNITQSCQHSFGNAFVDNGTLYVYATRCARYEVPHPWCPRPPTLGPCPCWHGGDVADCAIDVFWTTDLEHWETKPVFFPNTNLPNVDVAATPGRPDMTYIMVWERGGLLVTNASTPTEGWVKPNGSLHGPDMGCPSVKYVEAEETFYVVGGGIGVHAAKSRDLINWTAASAPVATCGGANSALIARPVQYPGIFSWDMPTRVGVNWSQFVANDTNHWDTDASDLDLVEWTRPDTHTPVTMLVYICGNQKTDGFGAVSVFEGTMVDYFFNLFQ